MGLAGRVGDFSSNVQQNVKMTMARLMLISLKLISGAAIGLTLSLIGQQIMVYGTVAFLFVIVTTTMAFMRLSRAWTFTQILVFDLICVLMAILLRMYILIAPG